MSTTQSSTASQQAPTQQQLNEEFTKLNSIYFDPRFPTIQSDSEVREKRDNRTNFDAPIHHPTSLTEKSQSSAVPNAMLPSVHSNSKGGSHRSASFATRKGQEGGTRQNTRRTRMSSNASRYASTDSTEMVGGKEAWTEQVELDETSEDETEDSDEWNPSEESSSEDGRPERGTGVSQSRIQVQGRGGQEGVTEKRGKGVWARYIEQEIVPEEREEILVGEGRRLRARRIE